MGEYMHLAGFAADVHSQHGEDGILAEVLDRIESGAALSKWCVEFGAADGVWLSNTCNLIRSRGFRAVMIEADPRRGRLLERNHPGDQVVKLIRKVGLHGDDRLDVILDGCAVPTDLDVVSIDIDGCDHWVLASMETHLPKVIVIEFNPTMPNALEYVQPPDFGVRHGSSPRSILQLAQSKGY
ncbi:MAG: hypothetical protein EBX39_11655, partial [Actinobacteria bacterium]|nr:hypothetical protein [Actinomycetota bacterium]